MPAFGSSPLVDLDVVLQHIRENDLDPATARTCAPSSGLPGHMPGIKGCNMCDRCIFDRDHNNVAAFKGRGPKTVIYYLKANDGTNHQKEDEMPCHLFVQVLGDRKIASDMARAQGKRGNPGPEEIEIIGIEGDTYLANVMVNRIDKPFNPKNEDGRWDFDRKEVIASAYKHAREGVGTSYEAELERRRQHRKEQMKPAPFQRMAMSTDTEAPVVAEPVKRGPGRPPNPKPLAEPPA